MAYASQPHVEARNVARGPYTTTTKPSASQVAVMIDQCAAEIDAALDRAGYDAPAITTASSAQLFLQSANAVGACWMIERSAQASDREKDFEMAYKAALRMIEDKGVPGLSKSSDLALPRYSPRGASPMFWATQVM